MGKRELIALPNLSSWCLAMVGRLFFAVPRGCLQFVIVVFPDHNHLLLLEGLLVLQCYITASDRISSIQTLEGLLILQSSTSYHRNYDHGEEECSEMSGILFRDTKVSWGVCTRRVWLKGLTSKKKHALIPVHSKSLREKARQLQSSH